MPRNVPQESYTCIAPNDTGDRKGLCGGPSVGKSLCSTHLRRLQRNGTLVRKRAPHGYYTNCKHPDGCPFPTVKQGWCNKHSARIRKHGEPGPVGEWAHDATPMPPCKHPGGCNQDAWARGWCSMHYLRVLSSPTGDPGPVERLRPSGKQPGPPCKHEDGCPRPGNRGDGWCQMHRERIRRTGEPGPAGPLLRRPSVYTEVA